VPDLENSTSGIPWSPTGYHSDRRAFYIVADTLRLYAKAAMVKVKRTRTLMDYAARWNVVNQSLRGCMLHCLKRH
jgi:hypothetical protein